MLVRDHTSKAFQPKYKDFCIIGFLGKNQIEIKDNHGHKTKVHHRDIKKIPMTEKVCQLYEEEQMDKCRDSRKVIPKNKMPDLGWDIAETQLQTPDNARETPRINRTCDYINICTTSDNNHNSSTNSNSVTAHQIIHSRICE